MVGRYLKQIAKYNLKTHTHTKGRGCQMGNILCICEAENLTQIGKENCRKEGVNQAFCRTQYTCTDSQEVQRRHKLGRHIHSDCFSFDTKTTVSGSYLYRYCNFISIQFLHSAAGLEMSSGDSDRNTLLIKKPSNLVGL